MAAPIERCYEIAADIERGPEWQGSLRNVNVLERGPDERAVLVETESDAKLKSVRARLRSDGPAVGSTRTCWCRQRAEESVHGTRTSSPFAGASRGGRNAVARSLRTAQAGGRVARTAGSEPGSGCRSGGPCGTPCHAEGAAIGGVGSHPPRGLALTHTAARARRHPADLARAMSVALEPPQPILNRRFVESPLLLLLRPRPPNPRGAGDAA